MSSRTFWIMLAGAVMLPLAIVWIGDILSWALIARELGPG